HGSLEIWGHVDRRLRPPYLAGRLPARDEGIAAAMPAKLLPGATGVVALADGTVLQGKGCGAVGEAVGEVCFNTAMSGYQEILTDPSYMAQIIAFTFPHIGNVGTNGQDLEQVSGAADIAARGAIFRDAPTAPANWRSNDDLGDWL